MNKFERVLSVISTLITEHEAQWRQRNEARQQEYKAYLAPLMARERKRGGEESGLDILPVHSGRPYAAWCR